MRVVANVRRRSLGPSRKWEIFPGSKNYDRSLVLVLSVSKERKFENRYGITPRSIYIGGRDVVIWLHFRLADDHGPHTGPD